MSKTITLGGASGYWGESDMAWAQLLRAAPDYLVFDYLAEITMSLLARMRARDPQAGYVPDFTANLARHLPDIADRGVRIISNAGGVNPVACAEIVREAVRKAGLDLSVGVVTGDDLMDRLDALSGTADMFSGEALPDAGRIVSANAYLGAFPIAEALGAGADIVITGRCVDSAVTLGALIHEFGWQADDLDRLAQGSLVGHLLECGPQVTGGNFTDWRDSGDLADIGYPLAEVSADGSCTITKPDGTSGIVNRGTVAEQMLYEIGDPAHYVLPDVVCDFTQVRIEETGLNRVHVSGARGRGRPGDYKTSITARDGHRIAVMFFMIGEAVADKAQAFFEATLVRTRRKLEARTMADFSQVELERVGDDTHFGGGRTAREIAFRISARHEDAAACTLLLKEASGLGLATPPGLVIYSGARPKPQPVVRLFSTLIAKDRVEVDLDGMRFAACPAVPLTQTERTVPPRPNFPADVRVPLHRLAWLRSGDKGDYANIGIAARQPEFLPYIWAAVTEEAVRQRFAHFVEGDVERWYLPGSQSMNVLMQGALGGGGLASLRNDPQGKSFGQVLAGMEVGVAGTVL